MLPFMLLLQGVVALHPAGGDKPGEPPFPPEYNASIGDSIDDTAPAETWRCVMKASSKMPPFELLVSNRKMIRVFDRQIEDRFETLSNTTLGTVASRPVNDVENGKPGIGSFNMALNKQTGAIVFYSAFVGGADAVHVDGSCALDSK